MSREGMAIAFTGRLDQAAATALWPRLEAMLPAPGGTAGAGAEVALRRIVLDETTSVDSAGLALLVRLAERLRAAGASPRIEGDPPGLSELRAAYRLGPALEFPE